MEVTLRGERPTLTVNVGDESMHVPLTFTRAEMVDLGEREDKMEAIGAFFETYLGDVYERLGDDDVALLLQAWTDARAELGMPDMGEPSASPER